MGIAAVDAIASATLIAFDVPRHSPQTGQPVACGDPHAGEVPRQRPALRRGGVAVPLQPQTRQFATRIEAGQTRPHCVVERQVGRQGCQRGKIEAVRAQAPLQHPAVRRMTDLQREIGGHHPQPVAGLERQLPRAHVEAVGTPRRAQAAHEVAEPQLRQALSQPRIDCVQGDIRGDGNRPRLRRRLFAEIDPRAQRPLALQRQGIIDPRAPATQIGPVERQIQPTRCAQRVISRQAPQFATQIQSRRQLGRRLRQQREAMHTKVALQAEFEMLQLQPGRTAQRVVPGHRGVANDDLPLAQQPVQRAAAARLRADPQAGDEQAAVGIAPHGQRRRPNLQTAEIG